MSHGTNREATVTETAGDPAAAARELADKIHVLSCDVPRRDGSFVHAFADAVLAALEELRTGRDVDPAGTFLRAGSLMDLLAVHFHDAAERERFHASARHARQNRDLAVEKGALARLAYEKVYVDVH